MQPLGPQRDTSAWILQVWLAFLLAVLLSCIGIYYLPTDGWIKGFMVMALFFTIGSTFSLAKTVRDNRFRQVDTQAWVFQVWAAFIVSLSFSTIGIYQMDVDLWVKGYAWTALLFAIFATFTLSKTVRDNAEVDAMHRSHLPPPPPAEPME